MLSFVLTCREAHICRSVSIGKGVCFCRTFGNDFHGFTCNCFAAQVQSSQPYFTDSSGPIPEENFVRLASENGKFEVRTLC